MNTLKIEPKRPGHRLVNAERKIVISNMIDLLCNGYMNTNALSRELGVSRDTVESYRPLADEIIGKIKLDRNVIRNLQVRRLYGLLEHLTDDLMTEKDTKTRMLIHDKIAKYSSLLASVTGINQEFTPTDEKGTRLVIVRAKESVPTEGEIVPTQQG